MKFNQIALLAGLALVAIALFSLGLLTPKVRSPYDEDVDTSFDTPFEIRSPMRYRVHEVDGVKVDHGENIYGDTEAGSTRTTPNDEKQDVARGEAPDAHAATTAVTTAERSPLEDGAPAGGGSPAPAVALTAAQLPPPAWMTHVNTKPSSVLNVNGNAIEPINVQTRAKLSFLTNGFKYLLNYKQARSEPGHQMRKIWIDVGARFFPKGSTHWFSKKYPNASDFEAYLFDVLNEAHTYKPVVERKFFKHFEFHVKAVWTHDDGVEMKGQKMPVVKFEEKTVASDNRKIWKIDSINLARWIKETFKPEDFIVMKFDIEGGEWAVLPFLAKEGVLGPYVKEMFFECHPRNVFSWGNTIPPECVDFTNWVREQGVHCHRWT